MSDEANQLKELLNAHRRTTGLALTQRALFGKSHVAPSIETTIENGRTAIQNVKEALRSLGHAVDDLPIIDNANDIPAVNSSSLKQLQNQIRDLEGGDREKSSQMSIKLTAVILLVIGAFIIGILSTFLIMTRITAQANNSILPPKVNITDLEVASGRNYRVSALQNGVHSYIDRTYVYVRIPQKLEGKPYIITANDDKLSTEGFFVKFIIDRDAMIYVAYNDCYTTKPAWLSQFQDTSEEVIMTDAENTQATYSLYAREFSAGSVLLGGNIAQNEFQECGMYSIIISDN